MIYYFFLGLIIPVLVGVVEGGDEEVEAEPAACSLSGTVWYCSGRTNEVSAAGLHSTQFLCTLGYILCKAL